MLFSCCTHFPHRRVDTYIHDSFPLVLKGQYPHDLFCNVNELEVVRSFKIYLMGNAYRDILFCFKKISSSVMESNANGKIGIVSSEQVKVVLC